MWEVGEKMGGGYMEDGKMLKEIYGDEMKR